MPRLTVAVADVLAQMVLAAIERPYPYKSSLISHSADSAAAHTEKHPTFHGCFDWHSAVHSHWTLARLLRLTDQRPWADQARQHFETYFTEERIAGEVATMTDQPGFELPYGQAWVLTLGAELRARLHSEPWARKLRPLEDLAHARLDEWLRRLPFPVRSGQHDQSAFAMTLTLRWAHRTGQTSIAKQIRHRAIEFHEREWDAPLHLEPSAHDFLSPTLSVAELMAEVLPDRDFARWLSKFCPGLGRADLQPVASSDRRDNKLAHLDGLNLSRAWMLRRIARGLPESDSRCEILTQQSASHGEIGMTCLESDDYALTHWIPTFALYWATEGDD